MLLRPPVSKMMAKFQNGWQKRKFCICGVKIENGTKIMSEKGLLGLILNGYCDFYSYISAYMLSRYWQYSGIISTMFQYNVSLPDISAPTKRCAWQICLAAFADCTGPFAATFHEFSARIRHLQWSLDSLK